MKNSFLAITLLALLVLGSRDVQAQAYGPYYDPYWDINISNISNICSTSSIYSTGNKMIRTGNFMRCIISCICSNTSSIKYTNPAAMHGVLSSQIGQRRSVHSRDRL